MLFQFKRYFRLTKVSLAKKRKHESTTIHHSVLRNVHISTISPVFSKPGWENHPKPEQFSFRLVKAFSDAVLRLIRATSYIRCLRRTSHAGTPEDTNSWQALCKDTMKDKNKTPSSSAYRRWLITVSNNAAHIIHIHIRQNRRQNSSLTNTITVV